MPDPIPVDTWCAAAPAPLLWIGVLVIALAFPLIPVTVVRLLNVRDTRQEEIRERAMSGAARNAEIDEVAIVTIPGWPSMDEVVYEDEKTGPTPVGFQFKADTVAEDVGSALRSRGVDVQTIPIKELDSVADFEAADAAVFVYPARHGQLPWQLLSFFDEVVEPRVVEYRPPLDGMPAAAIALGDAEADVEAAVTHMARLRERYGFTSLANAGIVDTPDRLKLYEQTLDLTGELLESGDSENAGR